MLLKTYITLNPAHASPFSLSSGHGFRSQSTHLNRCWWQRFLNPWPTVGLEWTVASPEQPLDSASLPRAPRSQLPSFLQGCKVIGSHSLSFWPISVTEAAPNKSCGLLGGQAHSLCLFAAPFSILWRHFLFLRGIHECSGNILQKSKKKYPRE